MTTTRKYQMRRRAEEMSETRRRITEAAVELHGTVGPSRTTVSAIAERAGVQRNTVYRHFPGESELFGACSQHFMAMNPPPDLGPWRAIDDPQQRLARGLDELYAFYERTGPMFSNVLRDLELVEALGPAMAPLDDYLAEAVATLAVGWPARRGGRALLTAGLRHAVDFRTWRSLGIENGLTRDEAIRLVAGLVKAAAAPPGSGPPVGT